MAKRGVTHTETVDGFLMGQHVFDSQTLGSFLVRRAWNWGESPATMARRVGMEWSIWTRDIDRSVSERVVKTVSEATQLPDTEIRSMTLLHILSAVGIPTQRNGFQRWLTPVGIYHRRRLRYGQLYCPECLRSARGQLLMGWRLGSSWLCPTHARPLLDSCHQCDMPFVPYRNDALMISRCDRCAASLSRGMLETAAQDEYALQMRVRALWEAALGGRSAPLGAFYDALTRAATQDPAFKRAGEPWSCWRAKERRPLLVRIARSFLDSCEPLQGSWINTTRQKSENPRRRRCDLPTDAALRAETLIKMAERVNFARRPKARIGKTA